MGDTTAWEWPCDNYRAPHTCLTAPCAKGAECDFCRAQAEPVRRAALEDAEAAVLRVEREGVGLNETGQGWRPHRCRCHSGTHPRSGHPHRPHRRRPDGGRTVIRALRRWWRGLRPGCPICGTRMLAPDLAEHLRGPDHTDDELRAYVEEIR